MPIGTCDHNARGEAYNEFAIELPLPDRSGYVLIDCRYTWDGVSTKATGCDGPVIFLWTRNTGSTPAWAMLPDKKKGNPWVKLDPHTDVVVTQKGTLNNLGLSLASDVVAVQFSFVDPTL
jgi:hypothetical protein